jgi:transcription elongation factor Elf1
MTCSRCGEDRLVEIVKDARGERGFCSVCSYSWQVKK